MFKQNWGHSEFWGLQNPSKSDGRPGDPNDRRLPNLLVRQVKQPSGTEWLVWAMRIERQDLLFCISILRLSCALCLRLGHSLAESQNQSQIHLKHVWRWGINTITSLISWILQYNIIQLVPWYPWYPRKLPLNIMGYGWPLRLRILNSHSGVWNRYTATHSVRYLSKQKIMLILYGSCTASSPIIFLKEP